MWQPADAAEPEDLLQQCVPRGSDGCCDICGMVEEWNDLPLVFVLDHIDGDATNNRRENLRMVCPNCDSQLPS
jgi:hypothetical protein